jgi:hypothetical protein
VVYLTLEMYEAAHRKFGELAKRVKFSIPMFGSSGPPNPTLYVAFFLIMSRVMGAQFLK